METQAQEAIEKTRQALKAKIQIYDMDAHVIESERHDRDDHVVAGQSVAAVGEHARTDGCTRRLGWSAAHLDGTHDRMGIVAARRRAGERSGSRRRARIGYRHEIGRAHV